MAYTADVLSDISDFMKEKLRDGVEPYMKLKFPAYNRIRKVTSHEGWDGKYYQFNMHTFFSMNASPRKEAADVVLPGKHSFARATVYITQYESSIGMTLEEMEQAVRKGGGAVGNLLDIKMKSAMDDIKWKGNNSFMGDGTGWLGRMSDWTTPTVTVDNDAADSGIDNVARIRNGMLIDIYKITEATANLSASWAKCNTNPLEVYDLSKSAKTFKVRDLGTSATVTEGTAFAATDGTYHFAIFQHGAVDTSDTNIAFIDIQGVRGFCDDNHSSAASARFPRGNANTYNGSKYGPTFQGVTRASYPMLLGSVLTADDWGGGTKGTATTADLKVIEDAFVSIDEEGEGGGMITEMWMNAKTRNWLKRTSAVEESVFTTPDAGKIIPGMWIESFRTGTGRVVPIIPVAGMPDGHIQMFDNRDLFMFEPEPIGWRNKWGKVLFEAPSARNETYEAWLRWKTQICATRCDNMVRIEDIDITE